MSKKSKKRLDRLKPVIPHTRILPDRGGSEKAMQRITRAYADGKMILG